MLRSILHIGPDRSPVREFLSLAGGATVSPTEALRRVGDGACAVLLLAADDPALDAFAVVDDALRRDPKLSVVALSGEPNTCQAVRLGQAGAVDYLWLDPQRGDSVDWLAERVELALDRRMAKSSRSAADPFDALAGESRPMREVKQVLRLIAPRQSTILLSGPTGSGKELAARAIHEASPRAAGPFVAVNCGAVPAALMETEFFGHVKGAFTGASANRVGRFEQAHRGTLFLDEVGELPLDLQAKLLRALQDRAFERVGGHETVRVDVRVVAATHRDLRRMVEAGDFREDLYYRLNVVPVALPSLAERIEDLPALVERLLDKVCRREGLPRRRCSPETLERLARYDWPGNVRQLENRIEQAVALSGERETLYPSDFALPSTSRLGAAAASEIALPPGGLDLDAAVDELARTLIEQALDRSGGNKKRAAELLGMKRTTFTARWKTLQEAC